MKVYSTFRLAVTILTIVIGLLFLSLKRNQPDKLSDKERDKKNGEPDKIKVSNTDYIFFESLSKYRFVSFQ